MRKFGIIFASFTLIFLLATGCSSTKSNSEKNMETKETKQVEKKTPLMVLKETQKVLKTIKGFKYSRTTIEKTADSNSSDTETGEEQFNPEISHFTDSENAEFYYEKKNVYFKPDGRWLKKQNPNGQVLVTNSYQNFVNELVKYLGTKDQVPGIILQKKGNDYVITFDLMVAKPPKMTEAQFTEFKKRTIVGKEEITVDATSCTPKKYAYILRKRDNTKQELELKLTPYNTPITIPENVINSASTVS
jgi:hypothetical protein